MTTLTIIMPTIVIVGVAYLAGRRSWRNLDGLRVIWRASLREEIEAEVRGEFNDELIRTRAQRTAAEMQRDEFERELANEKAVSEAAVTSAGKLGAALDQVRVAAEDWAPFTVVPGKHVAERLRRIVATDREVAR